LGFGFWFLGLGVLCFGFGVWGLGFGFLGFGFGVLGFGVCGLGVWGLRFEGWGFGYHRPIQRRGAAESEQFGGSEAEALPLVWCVGYLDRNGPALQFGL